MRDLCLGAVSSYKVYRPRLSELRGTFGELYLFPEGSRLYAKLLLLLSLSVLQNDGVVVFFILALDGGELHIYLEMVIVGDGVDHHTAVAFRVHDNFDGCGSRKDQGQDD